MTTRLFHFAMAGALVTGLALAQTSTGQAPATPAKPAHTQMRRTMHRRLMQELALSPTQKQQAKEIFQKAKTDSQPVRAELQQNRQLLAAAVKSDDTAQIQKLTQARAPLMAKVMATRSEAMAKFYSTLTPEQKAKADQIHQRMAQRRAQWRSNS